MPCDGYFPMSVAFNIFLCDPNLQKESDPQKDQPYGWVISYGGKLS
jgi:hypothetical protein